MTAASCLSFDQAYERSIGTKNLADAEALECLSQWAASPSTE